MERDRLDLLGGLGAGVLGAGVGLLFARWLAGSALCLLAVGIVVHGWAMFARSRLDRQAGLTRPRWARIAEWTCWIMLAALAMYVLLAAR